MAVNPVVPITDTSNYIANSPSVNQSYMSATPQGDQSGFSNILPRTGTKLLDNNDKNQFSQLGLDEI